MRHLHSNATVRPMRSTAMAEAKQAKSSNPLDALPTAKDLMKQIALREAEKASAALKAQTAEEAEKQALMERFAKPSGVADEERMHRPAAIIRRAPHHGLTDGFVFRFAKALCTDRGRAIHHQEHGCES